MSPGKKGDLLCPITPLALPARSWQLLLFWCLRQGRQSHIVPDSDHYLLDSSRPKDLKGQAAEATARTLISDWITRHAFDRAGGECG